MIVKPIAADGSFAAIKIIYLKDGEQSIDYGVEIRGGSALGEV